MEHGLTSRLNIIAIGAHPDDCEYYFAGTAAKLAKAGHNVKFLTITNGESGHHILSGAELVAKRKDEAIEAARRLGIAATEVLGHHDGLFLPSLEARQEVIRQIRLWLADVVLTHRPNDYHPDHRYTSQLVQDSAYMVLVPNVCPDTPPLRRNPMYFYFQDDFRKPVPFEPDVAVDITDAWDTKIDSLDAHFSQMYEWLPWADWNEETPPAGLEARKAWLCGKMDRPLGDAVRTALERRYGPEKASRVKQAEAFELCEYGSRPDPDLLDEIFPR
ncbi:MAG: PIG-L family deacetylase [Bryobacteraceae bacterium]|nr:PIG-L family deacetylase [Bryobacteraceae bacterium]